MKALIIVDLQYDFMPKGALGVKKAEEVIPVINHIMKKFSVVIASQDWHPKNHVSFAKTHKMKIGEILEVDGEKQMLWPIHCVEYTHGASIVQELNKGCIQKYFYKGNDPSIDSYSAFFDNQKKRETGLDTFLRTKNVTTIFLSGLTTEYCVMYTALDGLKLGYKVVVILDACRPVNLHPSDEKNAIKKMRKSGVQIIHSTVL